MIEEGEVGLLACFVDYFGDTLQATPMSTLQLARILAIVVPRARTQAATSFFVGVGDVAFLSVHCYRFFDVGSRKPRSIKSVSHSPSIRWEMDVPVRQRRRNPKPIHRLPRTPNRTIRTPLI